MNDSPDGNSTDFRSQIKCSLSQDNSVKSGSVAPCCGEKSMGEGGAARPVLGAGRSMLRPYKNDPI